LIISVVTGATVSQSMPRYALCETVAPVTIFYAIKQKKTPSPGSENGVIFTTHQN